MGSNLTLRMVSVKNLECNVDGVWSGFACSRKLTEKFNIGRCFNGHFPEKLMRAWSSGLRCRSPKPYDTGSNPVAFAKL